MNREISVLGDVIHYSITYKSIKKLHLRITPDNIITVTAPIGMSILKIDEFVVKHRYWIKKMLAKNAGVQSLRRWKGQDEEWMLFEGTVYPIVIRDLQPKINISLQSDYFLMQLSMSKEEVDIPATVFNWRRFKSHEIFYNLLNKYFAPFADKGYKMPLLRTQKMKSRWGSYSCNTNTINLNTELLKTPPLCIKLIIIHELCHLIHYNHGADFYLLHQDLMPEYKEGEQLLKDFCRRWQVL